MEEEVQQQPQEQQPEQPTEPRRHKRKFVRVLTNKYFIVTFIFAVIVLFVDRNNLIRWAGDYLEVLRQERVIRQYGRDIEELDRNPAPGEGHPPVRPGHRGTGPQTGPAYLGPRLPGEIRQGGVLLPPGGRGSVYCRLNWVMVRSMPASPKDLTASTALSLISGSCLSSSSSHFPRTKSI